MWLDKILDSWQILGTKGTETDYKQKVQTLGLKTCQIGDSIII